MSAKTMESRVNFHEMEIDDRILKAIAKLGWVKPTLIQESAIPFILEGSDVLMRARTGSGKTGAFAVPVIQRILNSKKTSDKQAVKALVLAPSKELCQQLYTNFQELTIKCSREITCTDLSSKDDVATQRSVLNMLPDIVIATPKLISTHLGARTLVVKDSLEIIVIDEADLIFSFGYEEEMKSVLRYLPSLYQAVLASATLSEDVITMKKLVLHNPVVLKLEESELPSSSQLTHYLLRAEELEKATILYVLLKLHLVRGKTIIFVNSVDKCYKLKLFLEQFAIPSCVLNSELPASIRCTCVNQFNQGMYDTMIVSDEKSLDESHPVEDISKKGSKSKRKKDKESGVSRGIDFQCVSNVLNFDFPLDVNSYIHRAGRTARGNNQGTCLSFVSVKENPLLEAVEQYLKDAYGCSEDVFKTFQFKVEEVEGFRYRANDAWRAVTKVAVRETRLKEIKQEVLNCNKLKSYFAENPKDLETLRHDKTLHTVKRQAHLADVPDYIVPPALKRLAGMSTKKRKKSNKTFGVAKSARKYEKRKNNPLMCMDL